jgi:hypothetical protein
MTKFTKTFFVGISVAMLSVVLLWAQQRIQRPVNPQTGYSAGISYSSGGNPTAELFNGEANIVTDAGADAGPILRVYDAINAAWEQVGTELAAGEFITFEGATADAFELDLEAADVAQDQDVYMGDYGEADTSLVFSLLDDMDIGEANSIWFSAAGALVAEGATADASEATISFTDPVTDYAINFNNTVGGTVTTSRYSAEGYSLRQGVPNPWRLDFRQQIGNCIALLEDHTAVAGAADTNVNNVVCGTSSFEYWTEQTATTAVAGLLTPNILGWLIETDDIDDEGIEVRLFGGDDDADVGWHLVAGTDSGYIEARLYVTDTSDTDQFGVGFMVREAYDAGAVYTNYDTYCMAGIFDALTDPPSIIIAEEADGDAGAITDTTIDTADTTAFTVRVEINGTGQCNVYVNGVATNAAVMGAGGAAEGFDAADFIVPVLTYLNNGAQDADAHVSYVEVGYLN